MADASSPAPGGSRAGSPRPADYWITLGLLVLWLVLQAWVLPRAGAHAEPDGTHTPG